MKNEKSGYGKNERHKNRHSSLEHKKTLYTIHYNTSLSLMHSSLCLTSPKLVSRVDPG